MDTSSASSMPSFSRRDFLGRASQCSALLGLSIFPAPGACRIPCHGSAHRATPIVDKGFASVRKVGNGLYATISDTSKGLQTMCNGGFLVGNDASLLVEGFVSPAGASFQYETLRTLSQCPVMGAQDTHYHFDHVTEKAYYGANGALQRVGREINRVPPRNTAYTSSQLLENVTGFKISRRTAWPGARRRRPYDARILSTGQFSED